MRIRASSPQTRRCAAAFASWLLLSSAATGACSPPAPQALDVPASAVSAAVATSGTAPTDAKPGYDVHEWGLVRADQGDKVRIGAVAPPIPPEVLIMTKPVLYFHPDVAMKLASVSVHAPRGSVVETWPLAARGADSHTMGWADVSIDPQSACPFSRLPGKRDLPCAGLRAGDECEALGLAAVRTVDSACVRVGDKTESFLFYRVETEALTPPLRFTKRGNGDVLVEHDGAHPVPGWLVRMDTSHAETRTLAVRPPPPRGSLVVGHDFPAAPPPRPEDEPPPGAPRPRVVTGTARADIRASMRDIGMRDSEVDSFMKAWDETLFGSPSITGFRDIKQGTTFLYFLPEPDLERAAKVTFDPAPRSFRRAFAVWTRLAPTGTAR